MPRSPRHLEPGGFHHVSPRGNDGRLIFVDESDRRHHLDLLERVVRQFGWVVYGYCQMTNHYHLVLEDPHATLSLGMQKLQGDYARYWNWRHGHRDHLFRNRFPSRPIRSDGHLVAAVGYVDLNPVRARMKFRPEQWPWSSHRAHVGLAHAPRFLALSAFQRLLAPSPEAAFRAYKRVIAEALAAGSDTVARA